MEIFEIRPSCILHKLLYFSSECWCTLVPDTGVVAVAATAVIAAGPGFAIIAGAVLEN